MRFVTRAMEISRSASSRISTVWTVELRPRWTAVRGRGDDSLASGADMRGIEFCADCVGLLARVSFTRVDLGGERSRGFREGSGCATVEDSGALAVSVDGHGDHGS